MRDYFGTMGYSPEELYFERLNRELIERIRSRAMLEEMRKKDRKNEDREEEEEEEDLRAG